MSNTTTPHDSKKRKRGASREEQLEQESVERYDKLVHQARKALHKQAKTVKQFESQKMARRLKQTPTTGNLQSQSTTRPEPYEYYTVQRGGSTFGKVRFP